ncbi:hypothetical protein A3193_18500 [Candidatus Thiodiazotropha endoloripes]|uniref:hypothetical protein n=1 Tax=Candidatus Thiodiazotropha endoloripes TaxID=1818881 RepID=UPI00083D5586|nr:hypothetical protein [Candidatus Thiodiazotropha endoloripes]ODB82740.1 hypothetical protein A3193_18500 [Candidatus Thiodiazotropha endoloripes]
MNTQAISEEFSKIRELEGQFSIADGFIHGLADLLFTMTMNTDDSLDQLDGNSLNSMMYQCREQADKCNEAFQELLRLHRKLMKAQKQAGKAHKTGELDEITSE